MSEDLRFKSPGGGTLPAILTRPDATDALFVLGHGSGSTIHVPFMAALSDALSHLSVATLRFEYPYSAAPDFVPFSDMPVDQDPVLIDTIRAALDLGRTHLPGVTTLVGGHSMSGHLATVTDAEAALSADGLVALGYPSKGNPERSAHLTATTAPLLIVQGTVDALGPRDEITDLARPLGCRARVVWIDGASHGFAVEGRSLDDVAVEIADAIRAFVDDI